MNSSSHNPAVIDFSTMANRNLRIFIDYRKENKWAHVIILIIIMIITTIIIMMMMIIIMGMIIIVMIMVSI